MSKKDDTKKNRTGAEFFAELEEDFSPLAGAPRHFEKKRSASGYQDLAVDSVRSAVLEALLATGYDRTLAEEMAEEVAKTLPSIQQKAEAQVA
jgi:hypothetical protein